MSRKWQIAAGAIVVAIVLLILGAPTWVIGLIVVAALAVPVVGYLMLDPSQRRRLRAIRQRRQIGR